ncbi:MAG: M14 family metallopeptidase [Lysobacteraceae bacterium]
MSSHIHPIGTPGQPWSQAERDAWLARQVRHRSHRDDVVARVEALRDRFDVEQYGELVYGEQRFPLLAVRSRDWRDDRPLVLVTGGVHGYETSGVHGALQFLEQRAQHWAGDFNLLVVPCVSPWAYERIHRWNPHAVDPNRSFREDSPAPESAALMQLVAPLKDRFSVHVDLHETTDSDETEFRPALAARDGKPFEPEGIPDGFYTVGDAQNPQLPFQQAIIAAVSKVTHIAPADARGEIIGEKIAAEGVILYPFKPLGLCGGVTNARYTTTTEVYPDSPRATPQQCNDAQVAAVEAALAFVRDHG